MLSHKQYRVRETCLAAKFARYLPCWAALALALAGNPFSVVLGADATFVGVLALAVEDETAKKLELSDEVKEQLLALVKKRENDALELAVELRGLSEEERAAKLGPFVAESEKEGLKLLTDAQRKLLEQSRVAKVGMAGLADAKLAETLKITAEQQDEVKKLLAQRAEDLAKASGDEQRRKVTISSERALMGVLTQEQRVAWERLAGFAPPAEQTAGAEEPGDKPKAEPKDEPRRPDSKVSETKFGKPPVEKSKDGLVQFRFKYAPWKDVIEWFATTADLSLSGDVTVTGTFNYNTDSHRYTPDEAIDILNSVLLTKGFTLVRRQRMLFLHDLEAGPIPPALIDQVAPEELPTRGKYELVKTQFQLKKMTLEEAERDVKKMLGPQGALVVLTSAKQIVVTETGGNLRLIAAMIKAVEEPEDGRGGEKLQSFSCKHLAADELMVLARPLLGLADGQNFLSDGSLRITVDPAGRRILATGKPEKLEELQEIITMLDVGNDVVGTGKTPFASPQIEIYAITTADIDTVFNVFSTLLVGQVHAKISKDPKANSLVVMALPEQHASLRATLAQMQKEGGLETKVITLRVLDPQIAVLMINKLFAAEGGANPLKVEADATSRKIAMYGSSAHIEKVLAMLKQFGEDDAEKKEEERGGQRVRIVQNTGSTREILAQIDMIWPTIRPNPIRVRMPSSKENSIRTLGTPPTTKPANEVDPEAKEEYNLRIPPKGKPAFNGQFPAPKGDPAKANPAKVDPDKVRTEPRPEARRAAPQRPGATPKPELKTAQGSSIRKTRISFASDTTFVSQPDAVEPAKEPAPELPKKAAPEAKEDEGENPELPRQPVDGQAPEIVVSVGPGGILIASDDVEALNDFEELLNTLRPPPGPNFTVFYLRYARAELAGEQLQDIIGGAPAESGGGSLIGDMMGGGAGGLIGSMLGLGGGGGGGGTTPIKTSSPVSIVADTRLNALVVQGNPNDVQVVESLLEIIDREASEVPDERNGVPRMIPVVNIPAAEAAAVVRDVFASRVAAGGSSGQPRQPSPQELMQALRGGGGRRTASQRQERSEPKMTIGVDARSNSLIVSAPKPLFDEVKLLVEKLDEAGESSSSSETTRVITLKRTNPEMLSKALASIVGPNIKTNITPSPTTTQQAGGPLRPGQQRTGQQRTGQTGGQFQPQGGDPLNFLRALQGGGGGRSQGGGRGGGPGGGGFGGGGFGGGQGGRGGGR